MTVSLPIPGLDAYVPALQPGWMMLVEGGPEPDKAFFVDLVAQAVRGAGSTCTIIASSMSLEQHERAGSAGEVVWVPDLHRLESLPPVHGAVFMDSLSAMALEAPPAALVSCLRRWQEAASQHGGLLVVVLDDGVLGPAATAVLRHLADAIVQFHVREAGDAAETFVRIPRWGARYGVRQPIHYHFSGDRIALDTRRRHV